MVTLREIELPVCPRCGNVGRIPNQRGKTRFDCEGPTRAPHKRTKMIHRKFREVPGEVV